MKDFVTWWCLSYSAIGAGIFLVVSWLKSNDQEEAKQFVTEVKNRNTVDSFDAGKVLEGGAKLVDAFTKAGPAMASLGASVVALGFAAYIVSQSPKDQDKPNNATEQGQPAPKQTKSDKT